MRFAYIPLDSRSFTTFRTGSEPKAHEITWGLLTPHGGSVWRIETARGHVLWSKIKPIDLLEDARRAQQVAMLENRVTHINKLISRASVDADKIGYVVNGMASIFERPEEDEDE